MSELKIHFEDVGPVLQADTLGWAIACVLRKSNPGARVLDQGSYLRVLVPRVCRLDRRALERELGRDFTLPGDLESVMPSFKGTLFLSEDEARWSARKAG